MRRLLPSPSVPNVDLDAAYWVADPGLQHVRATMVSSADGAAQASGRSGGLSGEADTELFALLRTHADVILVGSGTAQAEEYAGYRPDEGERAGRAARGLSPVPPIAVVTASASLDPAGPLFTDTIVRPLVITCRSAPAERVAALAERAEIVVAGEDQVEIAAALDELAARGLRRVSCEGGPSLLASVALAGRLDELSVTVSPLVVGGGAMRILAGSALPVPADLKLILVLEDDGFVFLRYSVSR